MSRTGLLKIVERLCRTEATDGELLERFVTDRDESAFSELVERHGPKVFAVCRRVLGHHQLAEDAYQATFIVLARRAHAVQPRSAVAGFLYGVARRAALEAFALTRRRRETLVDRVPDLAAPPLASAEPDVLAMLDEEIANLSEPLRAAVVVCELDGASRSAAARQLGIASGTLSSRLAAARKQLAARLKARGVALSTGLFSLLAESAGSATPLSLQPASPTVSTIVHGVLRTMTLSRLKLAGFGIVLAVLCASGFTPSSGLEAAPPLPKAAPDRGVVWVFEEKAKGLALLTAYSPDGRKGEEISIPNAASFLGLTPDGRRLAFMGKGGKLAESPEAEALTVHLRDIGEGTEGTDTGIPSGSKYSPPVWTSDMKRAAFAKIVPVNPDDPMALDYKYSLFDLATRKVTPLDLPPDHRVARWSKDGTWMLVSQPGGGPWRKYTLADGKLDTLVAKRFYLSMDLSPDGKTLIGYGEPEEAPFDETKPATPWELDLFDVATGKMTKAAKFDRKPGDIFVISRWSFDGTRVVHHIESSKLEDKSDYTYRIVATDPDGGKEVMLRTGRGMFNGRLEWLQSRSR